MTPSVGLVSLFWLAFLFLSLGDNRGSLELICWTSSNLSQPSAGQEGATSLMRRKKESYGEIKPPKSCFSVHDLNCTAETVTALLSLTQIDLDGRVSPS